MQSFINNGRKGAKPKQVMRKVYTCKRRFPKEVSAEGSIHKDPHENSLIQFTAKCNDAWIGGTSCFATITHMNNVEDKPSDKSFWQSRRPKINWKVDGTGVSFPYLMLCNTLAGEVQVGYILKYAS